MHANCKENKPSMREHDMMHVDLADVRHLELSYSRAKPDKVELSVEYVGGQVKVFEVDRYLVERLLEQLEYREM